MKSGYVPEAGDIVWIRVDPQLGREQAGHRPAVVLSPAWYNAQVGLLVCCPTTTRIKGYPFEVILADRRRLKARQRPRNLRKFGQSWTP